jgi:hypothetical protein
VAWAWLVRWRAGRHRAALWKSLVLPAAGAALCWLLLMTLWLPALDYARSYVPAVRGVVQAIDAPGCVEAAGLTRSQVAALQFHGGLKLQMAQAEPACPWRVEGMVTRGPAARPHDAARWTLVAVVGRPTDARDTLRVYRAAR